MIFWRVLNQHQWVIYCDPPLNTTPLLYFGLDFNTLGQACIGSTSVLGWLAGGVTATSCPYVRTPPQLLGGGVRSPPSFARPKTEGGKRKHIFFAFFVFFDFGKFAGFVVFFFPLFFPDSFFDFCWKFFDSKKSLVFPPILPCFALPSRF